MTMTNDELVQLWRDTRTWLLVREPFFGFLLLKLRLIEDGAEKSGVPTAAVANDGSLYLNREFISGLSLAAFRGLVVHEVLHPALGVFERQQGRDMMRWNVAHDYAINLIIDDLSRRVGQDVLTLPAGGCLDQKYRDMSAEEIYDLLSQEQGGKGQGQGQGKGLGQGPSQQGANGPLSGDLRPDLATTAEGRAAEQGDEKAIKAVRRDWAAQVHAAVATHQQAGKQRGDLPSGVQKLIERLLNPAVDWRDYLATYLGERVGGEELSFRRPSRRGQAIGETLAGRIRRTSPDVTILWDTSGSMNGQEERILAEVVAICEELGVGARMIAIDCVIHADVPLSEGADAVSHVKGGGGSDFRPAFERLEHEGDRSVVVAFTDGMIGVPQCMPPQLQHVLWVLVGGDQAPTRAWGSAIKINPRGEVVPL